MKKAGYFFLQKTLQRHFLLQHSGQNSSDDEENESYPCEEKEYFLYTKGKPMLSDQAKMSQSNV